MKLLLISADFPPVPSGEANHAFYLARHLGLAGIDTHVLTSAIIKGIPDGQPFRAYPVMDGWSWLHLLPFIRFVKKLSPDTILLIFLGAMYQDHPLMTFAPTICRALVPGVRFVTQFEHLGVQTWAMPIWTRLVRKLFLQWVRPTGVDYQYGTLLRDSHRVIVLSEMHRASMAKGSAEVNDKYTLIPPPPLMTVSSTWKSMREPTRRSLGFTDEDFVLVYYGYIYPAKGVEHLLDAVWILRKRGVSLKLLVVGGFRQHLAAADVTAQSKTYEEQMKLTPARLGISSDVIWIGSCPAGGEQASAYFAAADACVLPFDIGVHLNNSSVASAAAYSLPLVTTVCDTTEPVFRHGENTMLCPPKDAEALAHAVQQLIENPSLRSRLREGANALAEEWFCWKTATRRTIEALVKSSTA